jgi:alcohol dehydrogenase class IV
VTPLPMPDHGLAEVFGPGLHVGRGAVRRLVDTVCRLRARRVLVVHGRASYVSSGARAIVDQLADRLSLEHFTGFRSNPTVDDVRRGVAVARTTAPDAVLGIGGGSAMDVAKAIAVLADQDGDPVRFLTGAAPSPRRCTLILVPTLAGSGSEMTQFATVYVGTRKYSLDHPTARADAALVDPDLMRSVPAAHAVAAAADAIAHAVESLWSVAATPASTTLSRRAVAVLIPAVGAGLARGSFADPSVVAGLAVGSALAGAAINVTRTTAAHALSYGLTSRRGLPHGAAVGVHLRWLLDHNRSVVREDCHHPGGPEAVRRILDDVDDAATAVAGEPLDSLLGRLLRFGKYPTRLLDLALDPHDWLEDWQANLDSTRARNNARLVTVADVRAAAGSGTGRTVPQGTEQART